MTFKVPACHYSTDIILYRYPFDGPLSPSEVRLSQDLTDWLAGRKYRLFIHDEDQGQYREISLAIEFFNEDDGLLYRLTW